MRWRSPSRLALVSFLLALPVAAQEENEPSATDDEEETIGWTNSTDFSLVATYGNSKTETLGLRNLLQYHWAEARYSLRIEGVRSKTADDKFVQILEIPEDPANANPEDFIVLVEPEKEIDVEKYLIENIYYRQVSERTFWNVGFTWDRNEDANIRNRYVGFGGLGNIWWDRSDLHFDTSYGLSYTDRKEKEPDPEKDSEFLGVRLAWNFSYEVANNTTLGNNWTANISLSDPSDWNFDTTSSLAVAINRHLALKVSLQWLFNGRPALEDFDVVALLPEGVEVNFGDVELRKEKLDTVLTTSIVLSF